MLVARTRIASVARNASGRVSRRLALSSRVRSSHWVAAVWAALAWQRDDVPGQAADPLRPHRVPLVGHGAGADLLRLERLEQLALVLQQPEVAGHLGRPTGRCRSARPAPCCRPSGDRSARSPRTALRKPSLRGDPPLQLADLVVVALRTARGRRPGCRWCPCSRGTASVSSRWQSSSTSSPKSCIQSVARLPTVVSCAGWKWV